MSAHPPRPRRDRPREAAEVRRRLPRPRRRAARRGRLGPGHAGHPGVARRAGGGTAETVVVPWNDAGGGAGRVRPSTSSPPSCASPTRPTWASCRRRAASSSCCASCATEHGALLVFDEVITGFRVAPGGAQELTGVLPDLTVHGQGRRRRAAGRGVRRLRRADGADRAGRRRLPGRHAEREPARRRGRPRGARAARRGGLPAPVGDHRRARRRPARGRRRPAGAGRPHDRPADRLLRAEPPADYAGAAACDPEAYGAWCRALLARGVYPPPSQFEAWFPSLAHTREHVTRTLEAAAAAFAEIA